MMSIATKNANVEPEKHMGTEPPFAPGIDPMAAFGLETESDVRVAEAIKEFLRPLVLGSRL